MLTRRALWSPTVGTRLVLSAAEWRQHGADRTVRFVTRFGTYVCTVEAPNGWGCGDRRVYLVQLTRRAAR